jgi:hypothetical protein
MCSGHSEDVRGAIDQRCSHRLAAETTDVHTFLFADLHCIEAGRLAAHRVHARRRDFDFFAVSQQAAK